MFSTTKAAHVKLDEFQYHGRKPSPQFTQMPGEVLLLISGFLSQVDEVVEPVKDALSRKPDKFSQGGWGIGGIEIGQATGSLSNLASTCRRFDRVINGSGFFYLLNVFRFRGIERMTDYLTQTSFEHVRRIQSVELHLGDVFSTTDSHQALLNCTRLKTLRIHLADLANVLGGTNEEFYATVPFQTIFRLRGLQSFEIVYDKYEADDTTYFHHGVGRVYEMDADNDLVAVLHGVGEDLALTNNGDEADGLFDADRRRIPDEKNVDLRLNQINAYIKSVIASPRRTKWSPATFTREVNRERDHEIALYKTTQVVRSTTNNHLCAHKNPPIAFGQAANIKPVSDWLATDLSEEERQWKIIDNANLAALAITVVS